MSKNPRLRYDIDKIIFFLPAPLDTLQLVERKQFVA